MIRMTLSADLAHQFINIMSTIVDEFRLTISKDGWKAAAVDLANVAMIVLDLPKDNFEKWEFVPEYTSSIDGHPTGVIIEENAVGMDVTEIKNFFGGMDWSPFLKSSKYPFVQSSDTRNIVLVQEMQEPIEFEFIEKELKLKQGMFSRKLKLLPADSIRKNPKIPNLNLDYRLWISSIELMRIFKKATDVGEYICLGLRRERDSVIFTAITKDEDGQPWQATKDLQGWQAIKDVPRESSYSSFSLDYLNNFAEIIPTEEVWLYIGQDNPCEISFTLGRTGRCQFMLAPRIMSEI